MEAFNFCFENIFTTLLCKAVAGQHQSLNILILHKLQYILKLLISKSYLNKFDNLHSFPIQIAQITFHVYSLEPIKWHELYAFIYTVSILDSLVDSFF